MGKIIKGGADAGAADVAPRVIADLPAEGGVVHKRVVDSRDEAARIVAEAHAEAAELRRQAEELLAQTKLQCQEEIRRGMAEGESRGLAQVTDKLLAIDALRARFWNEAEPEVLRLVLACVEKIIGRMVVEQAEFIRGVVRQSIQQAIGDEIMVRVHPEDLPSLQTMGDAGFSDAGGRSRRISLREDAQLARGSCVIETEIGTIDARLDRQLEAIRKALAC